jgi:bifunctional ADP-heptose synthase (sugar kinase/adenylyltransferase)
MPARDRVRVVRALSCVDAVVESVDTDRSVCRTLAALHADVFANGGDQQNDAIPEASVCREQGVELVDGLGAKVQSSSALRDHKGMEANIRALEPCHRARRRAGACL